MSIYSMTGFGGAEASSQHFVLKVEIKSVNNRFKDHRFRLPSLLSSQELELRKLLDAHFKRGSFDIYVSFKKTSLESQSADLDWGKIEGFVESFKEFAQKKGVGLNLRPTDFLRPEFSLEAGESTEQELTQLLKETFLKAITQLQEARKTEGGKLMKVILDHKRIYESHFATIKKNADSYRPLLEEKLKKRLSDLPKDVQIDQPRFMQEIIYYLEKLDIHEEINRIQVHLEKFEGLSKGGEVGRQLEFLLQELNRETNTIGSKSAQSVISEAVIQMKVQLEKIREQILNLE